MTKIARVYFDKELGTVVVPDGACPYSIGDDDGSVKQCMERNHCGCNEREKCAQTGAR